MTDFTLPEYAGQTSLHPLAMLGLLILAGASLSLRTRLLLVPIIIAATTLPMSQRIVIAGADLTLMRILLLICLIRVIVRKEYKDLHWGRIDIALILWPLAGTVITLIHFGTMSQFVNRAGWAYDIVLTYFVARCSIRRVDDILALSKSIAVISIPVALAFLVERFTQHNPFSLFGGVPEVTVMREGKLRCQGAFAHPILAGTFWASALPMMWMLWKADPGLRRLCLFGTGATLTIIYACSSSTPLLAAMVAVLGAGLFPYRDHRTRMWIGLLLMLVTLHIVMKAPVWHLMARVDLVGGSTGWHRYRIFDAFVTHIDKWYLTGDSDPMAWGVWEMRDITNQYIIEGLRGGMLTLLIFVLLLLYSFRSVGRGLRSIKHLGNTSAEWVIWLVGGIILVHTVTFFGVSYFGQMTAMLYIHIALAGALLTQVVPELQAKSESPYQRANSESVALRKSKRMRYIHKRDPRKRPHPRP